jgi:hypothetical protein
MEDGDIQIRDLWGSISRLADLVGSEGDGGCEAMQNRYPGTTRPPTARNAADFEGLASRGDRLRVACCGAGASAEGEGGGRSERWRCGNAVRGSASRLRCKFEGRNRRAQRQTHRLESRRAAERNSSVLWGAGDRGRRSIERWRRAIWGGQMGQGSNLACVGGRHLQRET